MRSSIDFMIIKTSMLKVAFIAMMAQFQILSY